jgi:hypothetical protein
MNHANLAQDILDKIKDKKIKPTPKWEFFLKDSVIWFLVFVSLIIGALATSVIIFMFDNNQWDLSAYITESFLAFILVTLPYFWLVILFIFLCFIYYNFKNTRSGYKYRASSVIIGSIALSIFLGFIFYNFGLGREIDEVFAQKAPLYKQVINQRQKVFHHPENGVLAGQVWQVINPREFKLEDINRQNWLVVKDLPLLDFPVQEGQAVILIGQRTGDFQFQAVNIRIIRPQIKIRWKINIP